MKIRSWLIVAAAITVAVIVVGYKIDRLTRQRDAAENRAIVAAAQAAGGTVGKKASEGAIVKALAPKNREFVEAIKKASPKAKAFAASTTTVTIADTARILADKPGKDATRFCDEYGRFCFDLPSGMLTRRQLFRLETVFVRSPDGKTRVQHADFFEYNPDTKEMIPTKGIDLKGDYTFADEKSPAPPIFHIRPLAGVDHRLAFGAGAELLNLERTERPILDRLSLSVIGYWQPKEKEGRGVVQLGYRVYGNLTAGPHVGISTNGTLVVGAGAAIQIGR